MAALPIKSRKDAIGAFRSFMKLTSPAEPAKPQLVADAWALPAAAMPMVRLVEANRISIRKLFDLCSHRRIEFYQGQPVVAKGHFLLARSVMPAMKNENGGATSLLLDDADGDYAVRLDIANLGVALPQSGLPCLSTPGGRLPVGAVVAVMNPMLLWVSMTEVRLVCCNPVHFVVLGQEHPLLCDGLFAFSADLVPEYPSQVVSYADLELDEAAKKYLFEDENYVMAIECATKALQLGIGDVCQTLSVRAVACRRIGHPLLALYDLERGLKLKQTPLMIDQKIGALFELKRYSECVRFLKSLDDSVEIECGRIESIERCLFERRYGAYDILKLEFEAKLLPYVSQQHADYFASDLIEVNAEKLAVVTKQPIKGGTLLIGQGAFAYCNPSVAASDRSDPMGAPDSYSLLLLAKMCGFDGRHRDILLSNDADLVGGDKLSAFLQTNCLTNKAGVWIGKHMKLLRNACVYANCSLSFVGDMAFVRAIRPIEKGATLTCSLVSLYAPRIERNKQLEARGLEPCSCMLCALDDIKMSKLEPTLAECLPKLAKLGQLSRLDKDSLKEADQDNFFEIANDFVKQTQPLKEELLFLPIQLDFLRRVAKFCWRVGKRDKAVRTLAEAIDMCELYALVKPAAQWYDLIVEWCDVMNIEKPRSTFRTRLAEWQGRRQRFYDLCFGDPNVSSELVTKVSI